MKFRIMLALVLGLALVGLRSLSAEEKAPGKDVKCPVSGKDVNKDATAEYNGGKVYFCCNNCPAAFKKEPAKYATKANLQMAQTGQIVQKACPLSGKDTKAGTEVTVGGVKVAFCCEKCQGAIEKMSDDEKVAKVFGDVSKSFKPAKN